MTTLERALEVIERKGGVHEWMWRLIVDHGYTYKDIRPQVEAAWKYWDKNVRKKQKGEKK